jgi:SSS family solute:Na+ symporter
LRINASAIDYALVFVYFAVVLLIGLAARRRVSNSLDFFLSGRSLPAWITGLAFISANLGRRARVGCACGREASPDTARCATRTTRSPNSPPR